MLLYWLHSPKDVTKPRLRTSPLGSRSHLLLCVWQNNKSKALNLKVSFNTISKTNFHLFVSAIYHLHLIKLCPLHKRLSSARESKRTRVYDYACAWVWVSERGRWGLWVRVLIREKWELLWATRATRESVRARMRQREKRKNLIIDAKKTCTQVKTKAAIPNQEWEIGWPLRGGGVGSAFTSRNGSRGVRKLRE